MSHKVRIGMVGTSWWADMMHLPSLTSHPQAEVAAICGRDASRAGEMARKYGVPTIFTDYRQMVDYGGLDAVVVALPDDLHYEVTMHALAKGLHVLCEKPLALRAGQALEMYQAAEAAGVTHMVLFTNRWKPFYRYMHDLIGQGAVGRCYHAQFQHLTGSGRSADYDWRFDRRRSNGVLGHVAVHLIDMARWMCGEITQVSAQVDAFIERHAVDGTAIDPANDHICLLVDFAGGARGTIQASAVAHTGEHGMEQHVALHGQAGALLMDITYQLPKAYPVLRAAGSAGEAYQTLDIPPSYLGSATPSDQYGAFLEQSAGDRLFIDAILAHRPAVPSFYDGYKAQQVIDAALESARSGRAVAITDDLTPSTT